MIAACSTCCELVCCADPVLDRRFAVLTNFDCRYRRFWTLTTLLNAHAQTAELAVFFAGCLSFSAYWRTAVRPDAGWNAAGWTNMCKCGLVYSDSRACQINSSFPPSFASLN
jgi:hypothetical protein